MENVHITDWDWGYLFASNEQESGFPFNNNNNATNNSSLNSCFIKPPKALSLCINQGLLQPQKQDKQDKQECTKREKSILNPIHDSNSNANVLFMSSNQPNLSMTTTMHSRFHPFHGNGKKDKQPRRSSLSETVGYQPLGSLDSIPSHHLPPTPSPSPNMIPASTAPSVVAQNGNRRCTLCGTTETPLWRRSADKKSHVCNACGLRAKTKKEKTMSMSQLPPPHPVIVQHGMPTFEQMFI